MLTDEIKKSISESILCWLATSNQQGEPNCSPKEVFTFKDNSEVVIANIASPNSVKNVELNPNVCLSFVHVLKQKGFKLKGKARYISSSAPDFDDYFPLVKKVVGKTFKVQGFIVVTVTYASPIIAPAYFMVEGTTEESQIVSARKAYGI